MPDCPQWLEDLVLKLLAKKPEERPFNARAVQGVIKEHLIDEFGPDLGKLTAELPPLEEVKLKKDFHVARLAIGLAVLAAIIAAVALLDR